MRLEIPVGEERSRGKLSTGLERKIMEGIAAKEIFAQNFSEEAAEAMSRGTEWFDETPHKEELSLLRESDDMRLPGITVRRAVRRVTRTTCRSC